MKFYLVLTLLYLSIYIVSNSECEETNPAYLIEEWDVKKNNNGYCCLYRDYDASVYKCMDISKDDYNRINAEFQGTQMSVECAKINGDSSSQSATAPSSPASTRSSSSSFYLEVGILTLIFLLL